MSISAMYYPILTHIAPIMSPEASPLKLGRASTGGVIKAFLRASKAISFRPSMESIFLSQGSERRSNTIIPLDAISFQSQEPSQL